ncbi:hypothetical protein JL722_5683 [Aureococcus anophagefferens]|nr:hypothetical protein JL722_5683 [Aureococcus anophagefferens]
MSFILQLAGGALQSSLSLRPSIRSFSVKVDVPDKRRHKNAAKTLAKAFAKSYGEKVGREVDPANLSLECNGTKLPSDATCGELLDSQRIMICVRERKAPAARAAAPANSTTAAARARPRRRNARSPTRPRRQKAAAAPAKKPAARAKKTAAAPAKEAARRRERRDLGEERGRELGAAGEESGPAGAGRAGRRRREALRGVRRGAGEAAAVLRVQRGHVLRPGVLPARVARAPGAFIDRVSDRAAEVVLDALKKGHIPARARILEVGCGNGRFLRALGARDGAHGLRVSGVDILEADLGLARAHGGAPRLPWFAPAAPARGGYERVVNADITDARALAAALDVAGAGRYDALVSCSTMFWMGFPGDADDEPLGADEKSSAPRASGASRPRS